MLRKSYNWTLSFANKPQALWVLSAISFAESSFFPLPPDPLYIAMIVANRNRAWFLALICTLTSVLGGILGYFIGYGLYETLGQWIVSAYGLEEAFDKFQGEFIKWGFWIIALKGLTPIPYKIVTISSGVVGINMTTFLIASCIARGFRFFLVAGLFWSFGPWIKDYIDKNLGLITTLGVLALIAGFVIIKYII
ncbi:YqaA family protein [Candidatus Nucleicultrix amoebiphila]|jgi:membrane protein YqaA with SNARE-associated domain|uniref:Cytochrome B561 n=1 Tax=Candidatus Nucleicultrix amoebiphila FS5 TaxID=1414854 RepID=A0A1W6N4N6_9PROT|nr:YqaA family protein [Candidatus Nucleicultrix amoebiphila]ARN84814.1 cytochrome B561 [Candidatus Nucleicultrix amoebiphila FS5]